MNFHLAAFLLCLLAFAALALAMERHQEHLFGRPLARSATVALRVAGWGVLLAALALLVRAQGWALGLVSYSGHTSLCAGIVFCVLLARDRRMRPGRKG